MRGTKADAGPRIDQAIALLTDLLAIPGPSGKEKQVIDYIMDRLRRAGLSPAAMRVDDANAKSPLGGEVGNLIVDLPGSPGLPRRLLLAHCDTVPLCVGCEPKRLGNQI